MNESASISLEGISVTIGMPLYIGGGIPPQTAISLTKTVARLTAMGIPVDVVMELGLVEIARDMALDDFLQGASQKLFWIDADMVWEPDDFLRMLALSTRVDVVCAAYPAKVDGPKPTFYANIESGSKIGEYGLIDINGIGLGFTVVDRGVCQALADNAPKVLDQMTGRSLASVFRIDIVDGRRRTEDMAFFADIRALGYKVWLDPHLSLGHIGNKEWRGVFLDTLEIA